MQLTKQKGFTLVEIAIVLVIVGLLIGGGNDYQCQAEAPGK
jgi:prepilin-type N-terminal cleavage/methylation domain-containing protein